MILSGGIVDGFILRTMLSSIVQTLLTSIVRTLLTSIVQTLLSSIVQTLLTSIMQTLLTSIMQTLLAGLFCDTLSLIGLRTLCGPCCRGYFGRHCCRVLLSGLFWQTIFVGFILADYFGRLFLSGLFWQTIFVPDDESPTTAVRRPYNPACTRE